MFISLTLGTPRVLLISIASTQTFHYMHLRENYNIFTISMTQQMELFLYIIIYHQLTLILYLLQSSETFDTFDLPEVSSFRSRCNTWPRQQLQQQLQQQQQQQHVFMQQPTLREYQELGSLKEFGSSSALNSIQGGTFMLANRLVAPSSPWRPKVVTQVISN